MSASIQKPTLDEVLEGSVLLVDKPLNWTSFDVVGKLKWILRNEGRFPKFKIGHAGTLDPLATGLLVVLSLIHI
jgi:tRNA pseudouridine55 synthase